MTSEFSIRPPAVALLGKIGDTTSPSLAEIIEKWTSGDPKKRMEALHMADVNRRLAALSTDRPATDEDSKE